MSIYRSLWLGAFGAFAALAAVPTPASALTSVYDTYSGWASTAVSTIYEYSCIPSAATGCGGSSTNTQIDTVPLGGTQSISNPNSSTVPLFSTQAQTTSPWSTFWPTALVAGGTYSGDVWESNFFDQNGSPVTSVTLNLNPAIKSLGFVVLPEGLANGTTFTIAITGFGGNNTTTYYEKDKILGGALTCSVPTGQANQGSFVGATQPSPCGFFGFFGGNTSSLTISLTDNSGTLCQQSELLKVGNQVCDFAGIGIGDFVDTISPNVPEPSSLALLGAGLVGLGLIRRRFVN